MSMKVLIVEPDWHFARQATDFLESHAHSVVHEPSPAEALVCAERWRPDLVILAAELAPGVMVERFASLEPRPALLLTEYMHRFDRAWRAWQKGGDELLMKPLFHAAELHEAIVMAMENAAAGERCIQRRPAASA